MTVQQVSVQIARPLYRRIERLARLTNRPMEKVVEQTLNAGLPPLPDNLSSEAQENLLSLEKLDDQSLWQVARSTVSVADQAEISRLLEKNSLGTISSAEQTRLTKLQQRADQLMLRKAYAYVLLKWRGYRLPALAELETRGGGLR